MDASTQRAARPNDLAAAADKILEALPRTRRQFEAAHRVVPDGFSRARFFWPIPIYLDRADGAMAYDIDGRPYVDCLMGFGVHVLGHQHPAVVRAVRDQLEKGMHFGTAVEAETEMAERIVDQVPGAEQLLFLNSGTEATLAAVRIAVAATGRRKVAKFEGGWHGWNDWILHSANHVSGDRLAPEVVPGSLGISSSVLENVVPLPFNDDAALDLIAHHADDLACVIAEGVQGSAGCLAMDPEFARRLTELCARRGIVFVMDEVITGFRVGPNGAAGNLRVAPDLTTLGKAIGGGFPIGAVCGRADLMGLVTPQQDGRRVLVAGTFSGNPMTLAAGRAQLDFLLDDGATYAQLDRLGERLRSGLRRVLRETGTRASVTGTGSLWGLHLQTDTPPRSVRESAGFDHTGAYPLAGYLLRHGVLMEAPIHLGFLSSAHSDELIDQVLAAHHAALTEMHVDGILAG